MDHGATVGSWWQAEGRWVEGTGTELERVTLPVRQATAVQPVPPGRRRDDPA